MNGGLKLLNANIQALPKQYDAPWSDSSKYSDESGMGISRVLLAGVHYSSLIAANIAPPYPTA